MGRRAPAGPADEREHEMDEALRWYEKAFDDRTPNMAYAAIIPRLSPELAGNARYNAIVERMGFQQPTA